MGCFGKEGFRVQDLGIGFQGSGIRGVGVWGCAQIISVAEGHVKTCYHPFSGA